MAVQPVDLAIVGATGAVGRCMLQVLSERNFPVGNLYLLASRKSSGKQISFRKKMFQVTDLDAFDFNKVTLAFFSAGAAISAKYVPRATTTGCIVIDNTSQFRYDDNVALVVPEVNAAMIAKYAKTGIIANPNCSTIQMVVALNPLHNRYRITRINVATYQAVSGTGKEAIDELLTQTRALLDGKSVVPRVYSRQIAFNALPHIDEFMPNGYTREEMKMVWETQKILADDRIKVNPTTVRIPVLYGHSEAVHLELASQPDIDEVVNMLSAAPGIQVFDDRCSGGYPTAVSEAQGSDTVFVGRIRQDVSHSRGLNLWIVSDNLRKGAATNSIQIAEVLIRDYLPTR